MKKISGRYKDNQNFIHTVFYHPSRKEYVKIISSPKGSFCSSNGYTKEQIVREVAGMTKIS